MGPSLVSMISSSSDMAAPHAAPPSAHPAPDRRDRVNPEPSQGLAATDSPVYVPDRPAGAQLPHQFFRSNRHAPQDELRFRAPRARTKQSGRFREKGASQGGQTRRRERIAGLPRRYRLNAIDSG